MEKEQNFTQASKEIEPRAGLIPYIRDADGQVRYLMMVSSNPRYGGPRPMVSKGKIEENETAFEAAVREAEEELGFVKSNACSLSEKIGDEHVWLRSTNYRLTMYAVEVSSRYNFVKWGEETKYTIWLTAKEFKERGRQDHIVYVERIEAMLGEEQK